jgi:hypothetical protein
MTYKTNTTEKEFCGVSIESERDIPIIICRNYMNSAPLSLIPKTLDVETIDTLATNSYLLPWYNQKQKIFWLSMAANSTDYLHSSNLFNGEGNSIFHWCRTGTGITIKFFDIFLDPMPTFQNKQNIWKLQSDVQKFFDGDIDSIIYEPVAKIVVNTSQQINLNDVNIPLSKGVLVI